jgi:glycosyltransferase involved in cell wall biosynthesis
MISISIITPTLNGQRYLSQMLQSGLTQQGNFNLNWIVVDGGSTDGTLEILKSVNDPRLAWTTDPDSGQSAAINRGLAQATGDIVAWLNCDDLYKPGALASVADAFEKNPQSQWLVGRCDNIDSQSQPTRPGITRYKNRLLDRFSFKSLLRINMICQPAVFWRRPFGQSVGKLDESLHWTMDYDLWLRMASRCPPLILNEPLASFRVHPQSKSRGGGPAQFREGYLVARRYAQHDPLSRLIHRFNVEKITWGYRAVRLLGK